MQGGLSVFSFKRQEIDEASEGKTAGVRRHLFCGAWRTSCKVGDANTFCERGEKNYFFLFSKCLE